jgi:signal transduction histidine kinase
LLALPEGSVRDAARAVAGAAGHEICLEDAALALADVDVAIVRFEDLDRVLGPARSSDGRPVPIALASSDQLVAAAQDPTVFAPVPVEYLSAWLPGALARAVEHRRVSRRSRHALEMEALLGATDPERLPGAIAETGLRLLAADAVVVFTRGRDGKLQPGATAWAQPEGPGDALVRAKMRRSARESSRLRIPSDALLRRSIRKARDEHPEPFLEPLPDIWAIGLVLIAGHTGQGVAPPPHGVIWALKTRDRRPFGERDLASLGAIGHTACLALDHLRVVRDLQHRLAAMAQTRRQMEEDARAAHVGRVAIEALRALHSPIAYLRTNLRFLADGGELTPGGNGAKHLQYALDGLTRAEQLVEDAARVSEGQGRVPIEVRQLLDAVQALTRPLAVPESVEIEVNSVILGNASKLSQAIAEVVRNASQAEGATRIDIRASRLGDEVLIEVADDGEGVADDLLPRVREPFFSTRGRAGLGLTSAGESIEAGGGTLQIWSRPGIGTTVQILLPSQILDEEDALALGDGPGLEFGEE